MNESGIPTRTTGLKIAVAGIFHETNTFAPGITTFEQFTSEWVEDKASFDQRYSGSKTSMGGVIDIAKRLELELIPGLYTAATPSGMVEAATMERLLDLLVQSIDTSVDGLLLILHGAMVSEQYSDVEGECLRRLRQCLGDSFPIAVTLDMHANISPSMVKYSNLIYGYDTYPHVDMYHRAIEAFEGLISYIDGEIKPVHSYLHTGMLIVPQGMMTGTGAMKELMDLAFKLELNDNIINITIAGGFPYSDVPDAGMSFVVTSNGDILASQRCMEQLHGWIHLNKERFIPQSYSPFDAIAQAWQEREGPVILAEASDNVGGGAPADATHVLKLLVNPPQRALEVICDSDVVSAAIQVGIGQSLNIEIGGKTDQWHGEPVMVTGRVRLLFDGHYEHIGPYNTGKHAEMGRTVVLECGLLTLVVTEERTAPWDIGHLLSVGLDPNQYKIIVVKSAIAWQTALGDYAKAVYMIDSPGCCGLNLNDFQYKHIIRPMFPLDEQASSRVYHFQ